MLHNNIGFNSKGSEHMATEITKITCFDHPQSFETHSPRSLHEYPHEPYTAWKRSPWATFLSFIVWIYLLSNVRGELRKRHHLCTRVRYGRSRWSNVVDFGSYRKRLRDFLLVINSNLGPISHPFWDTATYLSKIANFPYPLSCPSVISRFGGWLTDGRLCRS